MADQDRMDVLPDALLSLIVSSLPFKEAVRTSILSKRWTRVWQATKNIEMKESFFVRREELDERIRVAKRREFIQFVMNFIKVIYRERTVRKFSLSFSNPRTSVRFIDECIQFAVSHNVETLELDFSNAAWIEDENNDNHMEVMFDLPPIVYQHKNLQSLKLFACRFRASELAKLIGIKHLYLGWMELGIGEIRDLLTKCVMLESLNLKKCWNIAHFEIRRNNNENLRLKSLVIEKCRFLHDWIAIEAPHLTYFKYSGNVGSFQVDVNRNCFKEADLEFQINQDLDSSDVANLLYAFLDNLFPARVLSICSSLLQIIPNGDEPVRMQAPLNVRHLTLRTNIHPYEFYGITFLLNSCPHLKKLTLILGQARILPEYDPPFPMDVANFWATNMVMVKCVSRSLEEVEVKGFTGTLDEIPFLAFLVHYGRRMKSLSIVVHSDDVAANRQVYLRKAGVLGHFIPSSRNVQVHIS